MKTEADVNKIANMIADIQSLIGQRDESNRKIEELSREIEIEKEDLEGIERSLTDEREKLEDYIAELTADDEPDMFVNAPRRLFDTF